MRCNPYPYRNRITGIIYPLILALCFMAIRLGAQTNDTPPPLMNLPEVQDAHDSHDHGCGNSEQPSVTAPNADYITFGIVNPVFTFFDDYGGSPATMTTTTCPNSNFSFGNFNSWTGCWGTWVNGVFNPPCNQHTWENTPNGGHFSIQTPGIDPCIPQLQKVFPGDAFSALIGNRTCGSGGGGFVDRIAFPITYDPTNSFITYRSAVVLDSPLDFTHNSGDKRPRFMIAILDHITGDTIDHNCGRFDLFPGDGVTVWNGDPNSRVWKDWSTVGIDLSQLTNIVPGQQLDIVFQVHGCAFSAHTGYAYVSLVCQQMSIAMSGCEGTNIVQLTGPAGYAAYEWRGPVCANCTPTVTTGTTITVNNALSGWKYFLTLTSYYNNCMVKNIQTTLQFTRIVPEFEPMVGCVGFPSSFVDNSMINQNATNDRIWNFGDGTATVTVQVGTVTHTFTAPGTYIVSLTRTSTDPCSATYTSTVSVTASPPEFDGPIVPAKGICTGDHVAIPLTVSPTTATVYWNTQILSGTVSITTNPVNPAITGLINDQITNLTGTDATVLYTIYPGSTYCHGIPATCTVTIHPLPLPIVTGNPSSCTGATGVVYSTEMGKSNYL